MDENKPRKIFIIGNGFDLNLGYPTRFKDFVDFCINWESFYNQKDDIKYVNSLSETNIDEFKLAYDNDNEQINKWNRMSDLKITIDRDNENELNVLDSIIHNNGFIKYLKENIENIRYDRWADFENYLLELCEMSDEHEKRIIAFAEKHAIPYNHTPVHFKYNKNFYAFLKYIFIENSAFSCNVTDAMDLFETNVKVDKIKYIKKMQEELKNFTKAFNIYLKLFVMKMGLMKINGESNYEDSFVIDFNYTNYAETIFNKSIINYIHGYQSDNNIIIGINGDELSAEYDMLKKKYMRLKLSVENKQMNDTNIHGQYNDVERFKSNNYERNKGVERIVPMYVVIIGQSLNRVDWDILIEYLNDNITFKKIIICYHDSYDSQLFNLYQMLKKYNVDYKTIEERINKGYYSFVKYDDLQDLLVLVDKNIENLSIHKYDDLSEKEEEVLKEIVKHQNELINGGKYLVSTEDINEDEMSEILERLASNNYIKIKEGPRTLSGPSKPYIITRILKY